ncbi:glycosyltransferase EpsD [Lentibacillus persicus]|uniref:Glycosyltransferase EpsD n=1 Tax=Lentibacillus persicus TaxID=640948 RepID=A0A1I1UEZ4_9BACI|nr:glycosyltransferase family 4 protein [Lentibacillus persicus]SFD67343.1 glycosyltransferase EpsD [Lentibacillus persicus]
MAGSILYCATVDYHFKAFHLPYMKWFKEQGWKVDVAAAGDINLPYTDHKYNIPIERSPLSRSNMTAYKQLKQLIDQNRYSIIHCHTPLGGVLARLAGREARKRATKIIYTAHGFHFCKGAPIPNWLIYYPIEKYLARHTDSLITINDEDFKTARKHRFRAKTIEHVHGVGVDTERFKPIGKNKKNELKKSFGYHADDFLLFNAAEFNKNKNQAFLLKSLARLKDDVPNARLLLAGEGESQQQCRHLAEKLGIAHMVDFLGFRKDIERLLQMSDVAVASSLREGLPVNVMEAMACGLPVVAVANRGHRELVEHYETGYVVEDWDSHAFAEKLMSLADFEDFRMKLGENGRHKILSTYSTDCVLAEKASIYQSIMEEREGVAWAAH